MATVSLLPATAGTTTASDVNDALYSTETNSMQVINGHLQAANFAGTLTSDHIRDQSLVGGKMVAATGTLDCIGPTYSSGVDDTSAHAAIPGSSLEFFLPCDASLVAFTWNIGLGRDLLDATVAGTELRFFIDGTGYASHKLEVYNQTSGSGGLNRVDLRYSGHKIRTDMTKGFHSVSLRLYVGTDETNYNLVRLRVRDMKVIWFK